MRTIATCAVLFVLSMMAGCASSGDFQPRETKYSNWDELQGSARGSR